MTKLENIKVEIRRSKRRTIGLEVKGEGVVIVRAPYSLPEEEIQKILDNKKSWIINALKKIQQIQSENNKYNELSNEEISKLADRALEIIPKRVEYFAQLIGVTYGKITIRNQKTRWGSCSSKGNLNFNCKLMLTSLELIDYVVVHELCHRKQMNHSKQFWSEVEKILPDYRERRRLLKQFS